MVSSGFFPDAIAVAPVRLVAHLTLALLLYGAVLWTALSLLPPGPRLLEAGRPLRVWSWLTLGLTALTIVAGGFVAGLHAGLTYNTFPLMDGRLVPEGYDALIPFGRNLVENVATVQFNHRVLATATLLSALVLLLAAWPRRARLGGRIAAIAAMVLLQYALGVTTLLLVVPAGLAVAHQLCATLLLTAVLAMAHAVGPGRIHHGQGPGHTPLYGSVTLSRPEDTQT